MKGHITVVCWLWGRKYTMRHVARLQSMLKRHLSLEHRLVCITDKPKELPAGVEGFDVKRTIPRLDYKCIRRMWLYSDQAGVLGQRLFQIDLDVVITDSIDPIVDRPEPFVIWKSDSNFGEKWAYNATIMLQTAGARSDVWNTYIKNPARIYSQAEQAGLNPRVNSDQAIATYLLKDDPPAVWTQDDGVYAYRVIAGKHATRGEVLPEGARIISFHGSSKTGPVRDPSNHELYEATPWIQEHWL